MKKKRFLAGLAILIAACLMMNVPLASASSVQLKAVSFLPPMAAKSKIFIEFIKEVEKRSKGELKIKYLGGPEVVGMLEQGAAAKRGVVDIAFVPGAMYLGLVPEAFLLGLSRVTAAEELEAGVMDILQPAYAKAGLYFWGELFGANEGTFYIWTNKKVNTPQQLAGQRWGAGGPLFRAFAKGFGADMVIMPMSEAYTAIERGLVDAWIFPAGSLVPLGVHKIIKYAIDHPFWADYAGLIVNLKKWNSLPNPLQKLMQDTLREMAPDLGRKNIEAELKYRNVAKKAGVEFFKFSPDGAKHYLDTIYETTWKWQLGRIPETGGKLKKILDP
jgi:TRAP-type C4-dicarboxylate transport system substrate-binding protein